MPKDIKDSGRETFVSMDVALSPILHRSKKTAQLIVTEFGYRDEISLELIRFIALCDEISGNFYSAHGSFKYLSDEEGQQRTKELAKKYQGITFSEPDNQPSFPLSLSDEERNILDENRHKYLEDNGQNFKKQLIEAANRLAEKTKDFKVNLEQTILEVKQEISRELEALELK